MPDPISPRPMFRALQIASGGLSAQRARLEVAAQNIANSETTRTPDGGPYKRRYVQLEALADASRANALMNPGTSLTSGGVTEPGSQPVISAGQNAPEEDVIGVHVAGIYEDPTPGPLVYDPGHPDADVNGYVRMPNVHVTDEMMEMMDARRVYDANATVFQAAKAMLHRALEI
ncbi:MAG: flagellar basal-body rod protein FlgC [Gemmatimonadetes bacterium]|nr:flagellar basal-body rod protein FlgC [Gemmatimonadota bacterium]